MNFAEAVNQKCNFTRTENGAVALNTSGNKCLDLYASVGGFSKEERSFIGGAGIGQCLFIVSPGNRIIMRKVMVDDEEAKVFK